jgi:hypothetical protein
MTRTARENTDLADGSVMGRHIGQVLAFDPGRKQQCRGQHGGKPSASI